MGDSYPKFRVAAIQAAPVMFDRDKTIDKAVRLMEEAADKKCVIVGFPELFIPGHPGIWFYSKKTNPLATMGKLFSELVKNGVKVPSPETDRLCNAARKAHVYVVLGISELDALFPGTLYISQLLISNNGEIMGVHRKMAPTIEEKLIYSSGDGSYLNVYDTPYGKLSCMNCGEHTHDLYKYALLAMGTQIHVASWPSMPAHIYQQSWRDSLEVRVRQFAHEGKIFVINSCGIADRQNIVTCCDTEEEQKNILENSGGATCIIGPNGQFLEGPIYEGEVVSTAEISLEDALPGKQLHNVLGSYTRWDVLSLSFNRKRLSPFGENTSSENMSSGEIAYQLQYIRKEMNKVSEGLDRLAQELRERK